VTALDRAAVYHDQDTFDVRATLRTVVDAARHYRLVIVLTCLATLGTLTLYIMVWPPVFGAQAALMIEKDYDAARDGFYGSWNIFRKDDSRTEMELITSGPVLREVIRRERLTYDDVYHPFMHHVWYLWEKSWVGRRYRAAKAFVFGPPETVLTPEEIELGRTLKDLRAGINFVSTGEAYVGVLTVKGPSPRVANIANTIIDVYLEQRTQRHVEEATRSVDVLAAEAENARGELMGVEKRRSDWIRETGLLSNDFQKENLEVTKLTDIESEIAKNRTIIAATTASLRAVDAQLAHEPRTTTASTDYEINKLRERAKERKLELQMALISRQGKYRDDSPEINDIRNEIAEIDALVNGSSERIERSTTETLNARREELLAQRSSLTSQVQGLQAAVVSLEAQAARMRARLSLVPAMQSRLRTLDRELAVAAEKYQTILLKSAQANVSKLTVAAIMPSVRVVEYAVPPDKKSWPKTKLLYPAALIAGLGLGIAAATALSFLNGRVRRDHLVAGRGAVPLLTTLSVSNQPPALTLVSRVPPALGDGSAR
jgi:uncharacterized protein involved in exopolysaccharide biosynthesis